MQLNLEIPDPIMVETDAHAESILYRFLSKLAMEPDDFIAYDTETNALKLPFKISNKPVLDWMRDTVTFWSLSSSFDGKVERYCLDQGHLHYFVPLLENPKAIIATWNGKYDGHVSWNSGVNIWESILCDFQVCAQMVNENIQMGGMDLKRSAERGFHSEHKRVLRQAGKPTDDIVPWNAIPMSPYKAIFGDKDIFGNKAVEYVTSLYNLPREKVANYASLDAYSTYMLAKHLKEVLIAHDCSAYSGYENLWTYFWDFERLVTEVLWRVERRGLDVDLSKLQSKIAPITEEMERIQADINHFARRPINLNSPDQLIELIYGEGQGALGLPVRHWTGKNPGDGQPKTDGDTLEELKADFGDAADLVSDLLRYKKIGKIKSTYVEALINLAKHHQDGKIHPSFKQYGARTGRFSTEAPNSQNMPTAENDNPDEGGFGIRQVFVAKSTETLFIDGIPIMVDEDSVLIIADFAQIEMRIMAHYSQDKTMLEAIRSGMDLHCVTVERMYGITYEEAVRGKKFKSKFDELRDGGHTREEAAAKLGVSIEEADRLIEIGKKRTICKNVGFAIFYGAGPARIAVMCGVSRDEASKLLDKYLRAYPGVQTFIKRTHRFCRDRQYVTTILGRRRNLPEINAASWSTRGEAEREAVNSIIQGSAADLVKAAMMACEFDPELQRMGCLIINQIHDELMFKCPRRHAERAMEIIKAYMEQPFQNGKDPLDVPTPVDIKQVENWSQK